MFQQHLIVLRDTDANELRYYHTQQLGSIATYEAFCKIFLVITFLNYLEFFQSSAWSKTMNKVWMIFYTVFETNTPQ